MVHRIGALPCAIGVVAALATLGTPSAAAEPAPGEPAAVVRAGHFSPDTPAVDVYLTNFAGGTTTLFLSDVGYGDVSAYERLEPGMYTVSMRPAGADPASPAALSWTLDAQPGDAFTACAVGMSDALRGLVLDDDLSAPPAGNARVRIIAAASNAPTVDIVADGGPVLATAAAFASTSDYSTVAAGSWSVNATSPDKPELRADSTLSLDAGKIATVVVLDKASGGITLRMLNDAAGSPQVPAGSVDAGGGALAQSPGLAANLIALGVLALLMTAFVARLSAVTTGR